MKSFISGSLSALTVIGDVLVVILLIGAFWKDSPVRMRISGSRGLLFAWIVALLATLGSLFYSDILGYTPCKLCWFQRIFMYPQAILLGVAFFRRDNRVLEYVLWLSGIGFLIAAYHYLIHIGLLPGSCAVTGISVSCSQRFVMEFGYITIPMMSLTAFALTFLISLLAIRSRRS